MTSFAHNSVSYNFIVGMILVRLSVTSYGIPEYGSTNDVSGCAFLLKAPFLKA